MSEWRVTATGARGSVRCFFAARPSICASSCELWQRPTPGFCAQSPSLISSSSSLKKRRNGPRISSANSSAFFCIWHDSHPAYPRTSRVHRHQRTRHPRPTPRLRWRSGFRFEGFKESVSRTSFDLCKFVRPAESSWLSLGGPVKQICPSDWLENCPGRLACSLRSSLR